MTASPDLTPYVDLTLFDRTAQEIIDSAVLLAQIRLPDWTPREGNTEVAMIEAFALEVSEAVFAVNRLTSALVTAILGLYGLTADPGDPAFCNGNIAAECGLAGAIDDRAATNNDVVHSNLPHGPRRRGRADCYRSTNIA